MANRDISLTPSGPVSGSGSKSIGFNWGKNQTRAKRIVTYNISSQDGTGLNTMVVEQDYTPLSNTIVGSATQTITSPTSQQQVTFNGLANGKYLKVTAPTDTSSTFTTSCKIQADQQSITVNSRQPIGVNAFEGGSSSYTYTLFIDVAANAVGGTYPFTVSTSDSETSQIVDTGFTLNINTRIGADAGIVTDDVVISNGITHPQITFDVLYSNSGSTAVTFSDTRVTADVYIGEEVVSSIPEANQLLEEVTVPAGESSTPSYTIDLTGVGIDIERISQVVMTLQSSNISETKEYTIPYNS